MQGEISRRTSRRAPQDETTDWTSPPSVDQQRAELHRTAVDPVQIIAAIRNQLRRPTGALRRTLEIGPTGDLTWICGARGQPFTKESFGNEFSQAARQAGIKKSAHGVRKIAATIAAENGATEKELDALFGWVDGGRTSGIYTRDANRARLATKAAHKLDETGTAIPSPMGMVRELERKIE